MGMSGPGSDEFVVHSCRLFYCLDPRSVIGISIELLRSLCCCHKMEYRIILIPQFHFTCTDEPADRLKSSFVHIYLIIEGSPVTYDQDLILLHYLRCLLKDFLLVKLKPHMAVLVIRVCFTGPGRYTSGDQLCGCLWNKQNIVSPLTESIADPVHRCGLSRAGTSCDHYFADFHRLLLGFRFTVAHR